MFQMNKNENGTQIQTSVRSERDKHIFFSLLKNTFEKSVALSKTGKGNQDMSKLTPIKVEVVDEEDGETDNSSCQDCSLMSKNRSFLTNHMLNGHKTRVLKIMSYKCSDCDYKSFNRIGVLMHIDCVHEGENLRVLLIGCSLCEEGEVHSFCVKSENDPSTIQSESPQNQIVSQQVSSDHSLKPKYENPGSLEITQESINKEFQLFLNIKQELIKIKRAAPKSLTKKCEKCDIEFKSNTNFMLHKRVVHDGEYRYQCGECDHKSFQRSQMSRHFGKHHAGMEEHFIAKTGFYVDKYIEQGVKQPKAEKMKALDDKNGTDRKNIIPNRTKRLSIPCNECSYTGYNQFTLRKHMELNHGPDAIPRESIVKCDLCEYETRRMNNCIIHKRVVHDKEVRYQCSQCDEKNFFRNFMERHFEKHHKKSETPGSSKYFRLEFSCQQCDKKYSNGRYLKKHIHLTHADKEVALKDILQCQHCEYETHKRTNLILHKRVKHGKERKRDSCKECGHKTFVRSQMRTHIQTMHADIADKINGFTLDAENKLFTCIHCSYESKSSYYIRIHKKVAHVINTDPSNIIRCGTCEFETLKKDNLRFHINKKHRAAHKKRRALDIAPTKCKFCVFVSSRKELVAHMKSIHPDEALFECDACSYKSNYLPNLNTHTNAKHTKEILQCNQCSFNSTWKNSYMDHMRVKHGVFQKNSKYKKDLEFSEIICDHCGFRATSQLSIKMHIESQCQMKEDYRPSRTMGSYYNNNSSTKTRSRKCVHCDYTSRNNRYLQKHIMITHSSKASPPDKIMKCDHCEYETIDISNMRNHCRKIHKDQKDLNLKRLKPKIDDDKLSCESCDYKTLSSELLERHKKLNHSKNSVPTHDIWKCKFCEYQTLKRSNMMFHRRKRHSTESWDITDVKGKEFTCTICNFKASKMIIMRKHEEYNHSKLNKFEVLKCDKCEYETKNIKNIQYHYSHSHINTVK